VYVLKNNNQFINHGFNEKNSLIMEKPFSFYNPFNIQKATINIIKASLKLIKQVFRPKVITLVKPIGIKIFFYQNNVVIF
jgi:hypothetical protein